jgi:hypothetical protein
LTDLTAIFDWIRTNGSVFWLLSTVSVFMFVATLSALPFIVARIPEDYFMREEESSPEGYSNHPLLRHVFMIARNIVGIIFILAGIGMLFLPGQGIVTILIGILLTTFPGKRRLLLKIVKQHQVLDTLNWMRRKAHKPPLRLP